jgi:hypothetical protein
MNKTNKIIKLDKEIIEWIQLKQMQRATAYGYNWKFFKNKKEEEEFLKNRNNNEAMK